MSNRLLNWVIGSFTGVFLVLLMVDAAIADYEVPQALYPIVGLIVGQAVRTKIGRTGDDDERE